MPEKRSADTRPLVRTRPRGPWAALAAGALAIAAVIALIAPAGQTVRYLWVELAALVVVCAVLVTVHRERRGMLQLLKSWRSGPTAPSDGVPTYAGDGEEATALADSGKLAVAPGSSSTS